MGSQTRWAGFLPVCAWVNEFKSAIQVYDSAPPEGCVQNEDGSAYRDHSLEDGEWIDVGHLDAVLRPIGPFISTMEATKKVTVSLVLPMVGLLMKALDKDTPVVVKDYSNLSELRSFQVKVRPCHAPPFLFSKSSSFALTLNAIGIDNALQTCCTFDCMPCLQGEELMSTAFKVRKELLFENKKRFMEGERVGHMEDLLVSTILDPRYLSVFLSAFLLVSDMLPLAGSN